MATIVISPTLKYQTQDARRLFAYKLLAQAAMKEIRRNEIHIHYPEDKPSNTEPLIKKLLENPNNEIILNGPAMQDILKKIEGKYQEVSVLVYDTHEQIPFFTNPRILGLREAVQELETNASTHFPEFTQFELISLEKFVNKPSGPNPPRAA